MAAAASFTLAHAHPMTIISIGAGRASMAAKMVPVTVTKATSRLRTIAHLDGWQLSYQTPNAAIAAASKARTASHQSPPQHPAKYSATTNAANSGIQAMTSRSHWVGHGQIPKAQRTTQTTMTTAAPIYIPRTTYQKTGGRLSPIQVVTAIPTTVRLTATARSAAME